MITVTQQCDNLFINLGDKSLRTSQEEELCIILRRRVIGMVMTPSIQSVVRKHCFLNF